MRIFVTGATGFIGTAIVQELLSAGHLVLGLTRSAAGAQKLKALGAQAHPGRLDQLTRLREGAAACDGVIHTAFIHGLSHLNLSNRLRLFAGALNGGIMSSFMRILQTTECRAIEALGSALVGSGRPLIVTSGILFLPPGRVSHETDSHVTDVPTRAFSETAALDFAARGVRAAIVRLAPSVHGAGDHGFVPQIIQAARKNGVSAFIGEGHNRWPAVHQLDAARLFRLALEKGEAGDRFHGVAESGIEFRKIAQKVADRLQVPAEGRPRALAGKHFGFLTDFVAADNPSDSDWTRKKLGWAPRELELLPDMDANYFAAAGERPAGAERIHEASSQH